jgi:hypothetical protein
MKDAPATDAGVLVEVCKEEKVVVLIGLEVAVETPIVGLVVALGCIGTGMEATVRAMA